MAGRATHYDHRPNNHPILFLETSSQKIDPFEASGDEPIFITYVDESLIVFLELIPADTI
jgi:hypothetical protein